MKHFLTIGFLAILICVGAQNKKTILQMPTAECPKDTETGLITYTASFTSSLSDSVLYKRSVHWYSTAIKSIRIQTEECVVGKKIVAKGELNYMRPIEKKEQDVAGRLKYTMVTMFENGTVTTVITRFNTVASKYTPMEPWEELQKNDYLYKFYLLNVEEQSLDILSQFKESVDVKYIK